MATIKIDSEFVKLARRMRDAQRAAKYSQKDQRRASSLEQLFDAKLASVEKELAAVEKKETPADPQLFDVKKVN